MENTDKFVDIRPSEEISGELLFSDCSAPPSPVKLWFWILFGDFIAAILYGIAVEAANGSIDAQMEGAPAFLTTAAVISIFLFLYIRKNVTAIVSHIEIYERAVLISAPKIAVGAKRAHAEDENEIRALYRGDVKDVTQKGRQVVITDSTGERYYFPRMKKSEQIFTRLQGFRE